LLRSIPALCLGLLATAAATAATDPPATPHQITVYAGQGADLNLLEVPRAILTGDLERESSFFAGASYGRTYGTLAGSWPALSGSVLGSLQHGYEVILLQHHGRQSNAELAAGYLLRTPDAALGPVRVNFAAGVGVSHAFGTPTYEDPPDNDPTRRYRTQLLALFELEWKLAAAPAWALVTRVHHRSGVYGLIAPRHVGSNFIVAGLRYRF